MLGETLAFVALVLFASNLIATKAAANRIGIELGFLIAVAVNVACSAALLAVHSATRDDALLWNWHGFLLYLLAGAFSTFLGRWFLFEAVVRFGPARASIFQISAPLFTVVIAWVVLGEQLAPSALGGIALTIAGLFLVVYIPGVFSRKPAQPTASQGDTGSRIPALQWMLRSSVVLGIGAGLAYAAGNVTRGAALHAWNEPILGGLLGAVSGLCLHLLRSQKLGQLVHDLRHARKSGVALFALSGTLNIVAQILVIYSLRHIPVSISTLITSCVPLLVIPASHWVFPNQETITSRTVLGTLIAISGIAIILLP